MSNILISLLSPLNTIINDTTPELIANFDVPYSDDLSLGTLSDVEYILDYLKLTGSPSSDAMLDVSWGINNSSHPGDTSAMDSLFNALTSLQTDTIDGPIGWGISAQNIKPTYLPTDYFGWMAQGYIYCPDAGSYDFAIDSDDCSDLFIDNTFVVGRYATGGMGVSDNWNSHAIITLTAGWHSIKVRMEEGAGGDGLGLAWKKPGDSAFTLVSPVYFSTEIPIYDTSGSRVKAISLEGTSVDTYIKWTESIPSGTSAVIKTVINTDGINPPNDGDYAVMTNGQDIVADSVDLTGKYLWIKILLTTTDTGLSPSVSNLLVNIPNDNPATLTFEIDMTSAFTSPLRQTHNNVNVSKKTNSSWVPEVLLGSDRDWYWRVTVSITNLHEITTSEVGTFTCETGVVKRAFYQYANVSKLAVWPNKRMLYLYANVAKYVAPVSARVYYQYANVTGDPPIPWIERLSSKRSTTGAYITIYGTGFGAKTASDINNVDRSLRGYGGKVLLGGVQCGIISWTWTKIVIQIPTDGVTGLLLVELTAPTTRDSNPMGFEVYEPSDVNDVGMELFICESGTPNTIAAQLTGATNMAFQTLLNNPGSGQFEISRYDIIGGDRDLIKDQNYILCRVDGIDRFKWIIESREPNYIDSGEQQKIKVSGRGVLAMLNWSVVYPFSLANPILEVWFNNTAGAILKYLIERGQARGCFPGLEITWTNEADSLGNPWTDMNELTFHAGTSLLEVVNKFVGMGIFDIEMTPNLKLKLYKTKGQDMYEDVKYTPGQGIMEHKNQSDATAVINDLILEGAAGKLSFIDHPTSQASWGRREGYLQATNIADSGLPSYGQSYLNRAAVPNWGIQGKVRKIINSDKSRIQPFTTFTFGDWIGWLIPPEGSDEIGFDGKVRVKGITCEADNDTGELLYTLELNNIMLENATKLNQAMSRVSVSSTASDALVTPNASAAPVSHNHDHGTLNGLNGDDHTIYLTGERHQAIDHSSLITRVSGIHKTGATALTGDVELVAGNNISLSQNNTDKKITITSTAEGGGGGGPKNRLYVPYGIDEGLDDEFDDGLVSNSWITVDKPGYAATYYEPEGLKGLSMLAPASRGTYVISAKLKPIGSLTAPFYIETAVLLTSRQFDYPGAGLIFSNGAAYGAGKQLIYKCMLSANYFSMHEYNNFSSRASYADVPKHTGTVAGHIHIRIAYETANKFSAYFSIDGVIWFKAFSSVTKVITPTHIGICQANSDSSAYDVLTNFAYFRARSGFPVNG